jgi:hypothetical protein
VPHLTTAFAPPLQILQLKNVREQLGEAAVDKCPAGFYFSESATTRFYALILPRNEKGLKEIRYNKVVYRYFRVVRPATGVSLGDISFEVSVGIAVVDVLMRQRLKVRVGAQYFRVVRPASGVSL